MRRMQFWWLAVWLVATSVPGGVRAAGGDASPAVSPPPAPAPVEARAGTVRALLAEQRWREALQSARELHDRQPHHAQAATALGEALFRAGRLHEVDAVLAAVLEGADPPARALMIAGRLRAAEGRTEAAVALMERAVAAGPDDREVLFRATEATRTRGRAVELLQRYLELSEGDDPRRIESARASIEVYGRLGERRIWTHERRPDTAEIDLDHLWDPDSGRTLGFVVTPRVGPRDRPVRLLLDSGSTGLFVLRRIARKRGFETLADKVTFGGGGDGRHETQRGLFDSFELGGLRFASALASTTREELEPTGRYHGLVGLAIFNGYRVELDLPGRRLLLGPPQPGSEGTPYWTVAGQMLVRAAIEPGGGDGLFLLDTGATRTTLDEALARSLDGATLGSPAAIRGFGGWLRGTRAVHGIEVALLGAGTGGEALRSADLSVRNELGGVEIAGFVGLDLLDGHTIVIDTVARRVRIAAGQPR